MDEEEWWYLYFVVIEYLRTCVFTFCFLLMGQVQGWIWVRRLLGQKSLASAKQEWVPIYCFLISFSCLDNIKLWGPCNSYSHFVHVHYWFLLLIKSIVSFMLCQDCITYSTFLGEICFFEGCGNILLKVTLTLVSLVVLSRQKVMACHDVTHSVLSCPVPSCPDLSVCIKCGRNPIVPGLVVKSGIHDPCFASLITCWLTYQDVMCSSMCSLKYVVYIIHSLSSLKYMSLIYIIVCT